jgi:hypothetical protein
MTKGNDDGNYNIDEAGDDGNNEDIDNDDGNVGGGEADRATS